MFRSIQIGVDEVWVIFLCLDIGVAFGEVGGI